MTTCVKANGNTKTRLCWRQFKARLSKKLRQRAGSARAPSIIGSKNLISERCYGLYANSKTDRLTLARGQNGQGQVEVPKTIEWTELFDRLGYEPVDRCPVCGERLIRSRDIPPCRDPPIWGRESLPAPARSLAS